tara:strand:+ start:4868 stop:5692 length:825 start_codon:yes stop_codon:yes gene_type:complete
MFPDLKNEDQAATLLIIGRGFALSDYDSVTGLYLRQGKVNMHANVMSSAIKASGKYDYEVLAYTDKECEIQFFRVDPSGRHSIGKHKFTMAQAERAGLGKNFTWKQYPEAMLFARCISAAYRAHCPDALGAAPVYVEQHGEMEVDGPEVAAVPSQRAVPKIPAKPTQAEDPSTVVDEVPVRVALIDSIKNWGGCTQEQSVERILNILGILGLPTDGSAADLDLGMILAWCIDCKALKLEYEVAIKDHFKCLETSIKSINEPPQSEQESEAEIDF